MAFGAPVVNKYPILRVFRNLAVWMVLWYLRFWTKLALRSHRPLVIGIAGSVGKSTCRNALSAIFTQVGKTKVVSGNSETGIPLGILGLDPKNFSISAWLDILFTAPSRIHTLAGIQYLIVEMGIDGPRPPKNMAYLLSIVKPDVAILLNETPAHVGNYERILPAQGRALSVEEKLNRIMMYITRDDGKIISASGCKFGVTNADDPYIRKVLLEPPIREKLPPILTFGKDTTNDIVYKSHVIGLSQTSFTFALKTEREPLRFSLTLTGHILPEETQEVLSSAIVTSVKLGVPLDTIRDALEKDFAFPAGRGSLFPGIRDTVILDSSYNASSASVLAFLGLLGALKATFKRPSVFVMGDMKELGEEGRHEHELVAQKAINTVDYLYLVGPLTKEYVLPLVTNDERRFKEIKWFEHVAEAGKYLAEKLPAKAVVLFKGSQQLEEAIKFVLANKEDGKKLCRQDPFWKSMKLKRGTWVG